MIYHVKDKLPQNNTYVVCHYIGGNWRDSDDQFGCEWKVMRFEYLDPKSYIDGNNTKNYQWKSFGADKFFGQHVDYWFNLPERLELPK